MIQHMTLPTNKYPGICYLCGLPVPARKGRFERTRSRTWRVKHAGEKSGEPGLLTCEQAKRMSGTEGDREDRNHRQAIEDAS